MITYNEQTHVFHLQAGDTSYAGYVTSQGHLSHLYWGKRVQGDDLHQLIDLKERCSFSPSNDLSQLNYSLDTLPQEYPAYGNGDFRSPAYQMLYEDGSTVSDFRVVNHTIEAGKTMPIDLPAVYVEQDDEHVMSIVFTLVDAMTDAEIELTYTTYPAYHAITRSAKIINKGTTVIQLQRFLSMSLDFHHHQFDLLHLSGAWTRERHIERRKLHPGMQSIESRRGASSHAHNPFIALLEPQATEDYGQVYGINLIYSGNFVAGVEVDQYAHARTFIGINPFDFSWCLEQGESFQAPEAILIYADNGIGGMSRKFHKLLRERVARGQYREQARPILVNNWEATYFDFNEQKIEEIADEASKLGIELFVLDDGWFGHRNDDKSSLGDWKVNKNKLPDGLASLANKVNEKGLKFGLWFEPEMISPDSRLYEEHPDWCLHIPYRERTQARHQLVLDLCNLDVQNYIIETLSEVLSAASITYVKWDMNRNMTDIGSLALPEHRQKETAHRYMLGLYHVLEEITQRFPHILFESCSGGGGRFDSGMLYYMPQTWTSDNSDAISRLKIQYGTSIVYPISSMGAHVSAVPNHQVNRITPLETRGNVALSGNFGYELDLSTFTESEKQLAKQQVELYKEIRHLVQFGQFYRLLSPFEGNDTAWMFVSDNQTEAVVIYTSILQEPNPPLTRFQLKGLNKEAVYELTVQGQLAGKTTLRGDQLMFAGLPRPQFYGDFQSTVIRLTEIKFI